MQTVTTLVRAVIMLLVLAIGWQGWQLYGPSNEQLCSFASRAVEIAQETLHGDAGAGATISDPRLTPPALSEAPVTRFDPAPRDVEPANAGLLSTESQVEPASFVADALEKDTTEGVIRLPAVDSQSDGVSAAEPAQSGGEKLEMMLTQLEAAGVREPNLEPWGSSGELYRFSCRVPWGEATTFSRHFESIAPEPVAAVKAVADKIAAWRVGGNSGSALR